jgi:hypothetical protein
MGILEQLAEIKYQEGVEEGLEKAARVLLSNTDLSPFKIAEDLGVPVDFVNKIVRQLKAK